MLGAGPRDADRVAFLEGVVADQVGRHLPGDDHQRDGVAQCIGQAGDRVGGARAGRHQHAADLAGRARIAFRRMHGALLVAHQHMLQAVRLLEQRVVDRQHGTARIAEQMLHALVGERLDHHFGAGHFLGHALLHRSSPTSLGSKVTWKQSHLESKRAARALTAHRQTRDGLATAGGVPSYEYDLARNKIAHVHDLSSFTCAGFIWLLTRAVKHAARFSIRQRFHHCTSKYFYPDNIDFTILPG